MADDNFDDELDPDDDDLDDEEQDDEDCSEPEVEVDASSLPPYSEEVLRLFQQTTSAKTTNEKQVKMLALAAQFAKDGDPLDESLIDEYHEYFEEYERTAVAHKQSSLRLARLAMQVVGKYLEEENMTPEQGVEKASKLLN